MAPFSDRVQQIRGAASSTRWGGCFFLSENPLHGWNFFVANIFLAYVSRFRKWPRLRKLWKCEGLPHGAERIPRKVWGKPQNPRARPKGFCSGGVPTMYVIDLEYVSDQEKGRWKMLVGKSEQGFRYRRNLKSNLALPPLLFSHLI